MLCVRCGSQQAEGAKFCSNCGGSLAPNTALAPQGNTCDVSECPNPIAHRCARCGASICVRHAYFSGGYVHMYFCDLGGDRTQHARLLPVEVESGRRICPSCGYANNNTRVICKNRDCRQPLSGGALTVSTAGQQDDFWNSMRPGPTAGRAALGFVGGFIAGFFAMLGKVISRLPYD